jgi:hypothetical protein
VSQVEPEILCRSFEPGFTAWTVSESDRLRRDVQASTQDNPRGGMGCDKRRPIAFTEKPCRSQTFAIVQQVKRRIRPANRFELEPQDMDLLF